MEDIIHSHTTEIPLFHTHALKNNVKMNVYVYKFTRLFLRTRFECVALSQLQLTEEN